MSKKLSFINIPAAITAFVLMFSHCAPKGNLAGNHMAFDTICFGKSGGFANLTEKYVLERDGHVYKEIGGELEEINKVKRPLMKQIRSELDSLHLGTKELDEVGNMTYFLEVISDTVHRITWTESSENPSVKSFYKTLVTTLPKQKQ